MEDLEHRIQRLEARIELSDLVAKYNVFVDDHDLESLADLYADDAVFDGHALGRSEGRDAVMDYFRARYEDYGPSYHYTHTQTVDFRSADEASGLVTAHVELAYRGIAMRGAYRYDDDYVRERGTWRFRQRKVNFYYIMPMEDVPQRFEDPRRRRWPGTPPTIAELPESLATYQATRRAP